MTRPTIHEYYTAMLPLVASRGTCPRRKVGAILTDDRGRLVSAGYNGPPAGMAHCTLVPCPGAQGQSGDNTRCEAIHAEANAILFASYSRIAPTTLYCSCTPCFNCAKLIATSGIRVVIALEPYLGDMSGCAFLEKANVMVYVWDAKANQHIYWKTWLGEASEG